MAIYCKHCKTRVATASRGLCHTCYTRLDIRKLYPLPPGFGTVESRWVGRGVGLRFPREYPPSPTDYLPGTEEKVKVMVERAELGLHLYHPLDAGMPKRRDD